MGVTRFVTAISTAVAAMVLLGSIADVRILSQQSPLITVHMQDTNLKLSAIEGELANQNQAMAALLKDYTSREQLQRELDKLNDKIRVLQVQQAVIQQMLKVEQSRDTPAGGNDGTS
jgi:negative regulator of sigma E activity